MMRAVLQLILSKVSISRNEIRQDKSLTSCIRFHFDYNEKEKRMKGEYDAAVIITSNDSPVRNPS